MRIDRDVRTTSRGTQLPGYEIWAKELNGSWYVVDRDGRIESGPHRSEQSALWNAEQMTHTGGT